LDFHIQIVASFRPNAQVKKGGFNHQGHEGHKEAQRRGKKGLRKKEKKFFFPYFSCFSSFPPLFFFVLLSDLRVLGG
jgi:hypothetical protein